MSESTFEELNEKISDAKEKLLEPLEKLTTISSSLASFTLQWQDLEVFYNDIQTSILALQSQPSDRDRDRDLCFSLKKQFDWFVDPLPEIKQLCRDMNGKGLILYLTQQNHPPQNNNYDSVLASALLFAPDPTLLLLDALRHNHSKKTILFSLLLLEQSIKFSPFLNIRTDVTDEARKLAIEWKPKITAHNKATASDRNYLRALTFLLLLAVFRLGPDFNADGHLFHLVRIVIANRYEKAYDLLKMFGFEDTLIQYVEDFIQKKDRTEAIDCIYAFGLVDKFPHVFKILRKWLRDAKNETDEICENEDSSVESRCDAIDMEIEVIRNVIKCVEDHEIESKYNSDYLGSKIQKLKWKKKDLKGNAGRSKRGRSSSEENGDATNVKQQILADEGSLKKVKRQRLTEETAPNNESENPPYLNCQVESYGKESFVAATKPCLSSDSYPESYVPASNSSCVGGQLGLEVGDSHHEQVQVVGGHTSKAVRGLAGGLFKKKKKIVGIVGSSSSSVPGKHATNGGA